MPEVSPVEVDTSISPEVAARLAALPTYRTPTEAEMYWMSRLLDAGPLLERDLPNEVVKASLDGLIEQGMVAQLADVEMIYQNAPSYYAATVKGMAFFTEFYNTDSLRKALAIHSGSDCPIPVART